MKKNLKQLEINKLFKEFNFLKIDEEYKAELLNTYGPDFEQSVKSIFKESPQLNEMFNGGGSCGESIAPPQNVETRESKMIGVEIYNPNNLSSELSIELYTGVTSESNFKTFDEPKKDIVKKLYRNISTKTHPDKVSVKFLNDLYIKAQNAYNKNDLFMLYLICNDLEIPYEFPTEEIPAFRDGVKNLRLNNTKTEQTYLWAWIHEEDVVKKKMILLHFITNAYRPKI